MKISQKTHVLEQRNFTGRIAKGRGEDKLKGCWIDYQ